MSSRDMMANDRASAALGMVVEVDEPGRSVVSMRVRDDMTNGFHITHGGLVFALADTAFAIAKWSGLGLIGFYGYWAARFAGTPVLRALVQATLMAAVGASLIAFKALVH